MQYFAFQWHITDECDQRCKHCYIFSENNNIKLKQMDYSQMKYVVDQCIEMCKKMNKLPYFYITGGDPILNKDFWKLLELLKEKDIPFSILGNPFHLNDDVCKKLKEYGCEKYQMSIDGMKNTHDFFRKPGSFDTTIEKIKCINNAKIKSVIMTTVSEKNKDELLDIIDLVVKNKVKVFAFARYCPTSQEKNVNITPNEYKELLEKVWEKYNSYKDCGTYFNLKDHLWTLFLYEKGIYKIDESLDETLIYDGCHCGKSHLTILPSGDVYACRRMESKVGNVFEDELYDIFYSSNMNNYRKYNSFDKCSKCELLRFCRGCPAVSYGITHNMYSTDPQCWKEIDNIGNFRIDEKKKKYKKVSR